MANFSQFQYHDLLVRRDDLYAQAKYKIILRFLKNRKNLKILNAGCGSGELSFLLAAAGHTVFGIDPGLEYIALAKSGLSSELSSRCTFQVSSIENFSHPDKFDCVIATDVLEHIENDTLATTKLIDYLCVGGDLIVTVPALPALFGYHDEQLGHFRRYTKTTLARLINNSNSIIFKKLRYFGFTLIPICYLYSRIWRWSYPVGGSGRGWCIRARQLFLNSILLLERRAVFPFGTSLVFWGIKKD